MGRRRTPVVFGPAAASGFLHELIGHALEADNFALKTDYITRLCRTRLPSMLSLSDDPTLPDGHGSYDVDDEGVPAAVTPLVVDGAVTGPLTSVRAPFRAGYAPTGNGRRADYRSFSIPRASNTVARPGHTDPDALLHADQAGLLYVGCLGAGLINLASGEYTFAALDCSYITPGGNRVAVRDVSLYGDALDALCRLEATGRDFGGDNVTCGKQDQIVGIGIFAPTMRYAALDWEAA